MGRSQNPSIKSILSLTLNLLEGFLLVLVWTIILLALVKTRSFLLAPFPSRYWPIYALCRLVLPTLGMEGNRNKIPNISVAKMALFRRSFSHTMNLPSVGLHPTSLCWRTGKKIIKSTKSYFQLEHSMTIFAYWLWLLYKVSHPLSFYSVYLLTSFLFFLHLTALNGFYHTDCKFFAKSFMDCLVKDRVLSSVHWSCPVPP